jgi:predicted enzyme related to lactoylglutathione lyase
MTTPTYRHGQFVWHELLTSDVESSLRFYGEVFGWKAETTPMPDGSTYSMLKAGDRVVGGAMKLPMPGIPPNWGLYVSVADVEAASKTAAAAGGQVIVPPMDAGGFGRFTTLADPTGAVVSAWRGANGDGERAADYRPAIGEFCWDQLNTSSPTQARAFYAELFGWSAKPFPGGGDMEVWSAGATEVASVMQAPPGAPSHWLAYVVVDGLAAARKRVEQNKGKILVPEIAVPTIGTIAVAADNVGAVIGLFEPKAG